MPVRGPYQLLSVGTEHREAIESGRRRNLRQTSTVWANEKEIEVAEARVGVVIRRETVPPSVGCPRRPEAGRAKVRDLPLPAAVSVHYPEIHLVWAHEP